MLPAAVPSWHFEHLCEKCQGALSELFTKFGSMTAGGVDAAAIAAAIDGRAASAAAAKKEHKKEEPEETDNDLGFRLFD